MTTSTTTGASYHHATPDQLAQATLLRAAGWPLPTIADRVGLSVSTLYRHFRKHGVKKGSIKRELIDRAQKELLDTIDENAPLHQALAALIQSDISITHQLRERLAITVEQLNPTNLGEAVLAARAGAAVATALKTTSDTVAHHLDRPAVKQTGRVSAEAAEQFQRILQGIPHR